MCPLTWKEDVGGSSDEGIHDLTSLWNGVPVCGHWPQPSDVLLCSQHNCTILYLDISWFSNPWANPMTQGPVILFMTP